MASSEPMPGTKGTCNKAMLHCQGAVTQEIGPQDQVQHLIAFASTILNISVIFEKQLPVVSSKRNGRASRIMDAIANISISQARGETVAASVQLTNTDIQLIVASNCTLPASTLRHLRSVWDILKDLCQDFQEYHAVPGHSSPRKRPSTKSLSKAAQTRVWALRQSILRFNHLKLRRRVSKYCSDFEFINKEVARELGLEPMITQIEQLKTALDPDLLSDNLWDSIWRDLMKIYSQYKASSGTIKKLKKSPLTPFSLFRFHAKVLKIAWDINTLLSAAHSPHLRTLFQRNFEVTNLEASRNLDYNLPKSPATWVQIIEDTLRWRELTAKRKGRVDFQLDTIGVQQHMARMCETPPHATNYVHCELSIVSHTLQSSEEGFLGYIGISKPCCLSCYQCIQAVNNVLGRRFRTRIKAHQKLCYPWRFSILPHANLVAEQMRDRMCIVLGRNFMGFGSKKQTHLGHSEARARSVTDTESEPNDS